MFQQLSPGSRIRYNPGAFWFGTGSKTQKARNLAKNPNCIVGTQNAAEAVILEGVAELITDPAIGKKLEQHRSANME